MAAEPDDGEAGHATGTYIRLTPLEAWVEHLGPYLS
jgi:hypothetical protein